MTHTHVWHDSFTRVTWLIHTCDMTHRVAVFCSVLRCVAAHRSVCCVCVAVCVATAGLTCSHSNTLLVVLQYVAVCCSVLQRIAACVVCVLQCALQRLLVANRTHYLSCCSMLQCVAVCCSVLQRIAACVVCVLQCALQRRALLVANRTHYLSCCIMLHCVAVCCSVLQRIAACVGVCCSVCCNGEPYL